MSNATPDTRGAGGPGGERRRQRSRGGKGRNRNRQGNEQGGGNPNRPPHQGDRNRGDRGDRGPDRGDRGPRPPRREYKPVPLTWWQKILKAIGLYKEPVRPPRPEKQESIRFEEGPPREVKSNTRNARQGGSDASPRPPQERAERGERPERRERGERPERTDRPERGERAEVASTRIYLGNLSYEATEEDLKDLFKGVGTVRNVEIVYNRRTHKSKGYGFVDMLNVDEARRSVEILHDQFFMGRKLVVSGAKTKDHEDEGKDEDAREEAAARAERQAARQAAAAAAPAAAAVAVTDAAPAVEAVAETVNEVPEVTEVTEASEPVAQEAPSEEERTA